MLANERLTLAAVGLALAVVACGPPPKIQSNDILDREVQSSRVAVKHIVIGWNGSSSNDSRASQRTRGEADQLAVSLLDRVRGGEPIEPLMMQFSEDPGTAKTGSVYEVDAWTKFVPEFKRLAFRLRVGEAGMVLSHFGWHVMKRVR